jgi:hypothetical protein
LGGPNTLAFKIGVRNFNEHYYKEREVYHMSEINRGFIVAMFFFSAFTAFGQGLAVIG